MSHCAKKKKKRSANIFVNPATAEFVNHAGNKIPFSKSFLQLKFSAKATEQIRLSVLADTNMPFIMKGHKTM